MKKILSIILLVLTGCSASTHSGSMSYGFSQTIYTAPNKAFSVEAPYKSPDVKDAIYKQEGNNVQYVDFAYAKYYPELGFQSIEWLNNEEVKSLKVQDKELMKRKFLPKKEENAGLIPVGNNLHCESKSINGHDAFQCRELVKFKDPRKNYMKPGYFSMTIIYFNQGVAVAYGYDLSFKIHDELVNSIHPL